MGHVWEWAVIIKGEKKKFRVTHWIVNRVTLLTQTKLKYKERFCNDMHTTKIMHQQKLKLSWISSQLSNSTNTILDEWLLSYVN